MIIAADATLQKTVFFELFVIHSPLTVASSEIKSPHKEVTLSAVLACKTRGALNKWPVTVKASVLIYQTKKTPQKAYFTVINKKF